MKRAKHITVLDFVDSRVYQYKLEVLDNADDNTYERFITNKGHSINNCEWMVHSDSEIWADHSVGQVIMKECY